MDRRLSAVPRGVRWALAGAFVLQLAFASLQPAPSANAEALPSLPSASVLRIASLGDPIALAQMLTLYLQAFDNQPGVSIPFLQLDYARVENWLERILELDPVGQYPLLLAAQVYAQVPDEPKQRQMLEFVYRHFLADPNRRWPWLAHAAIMARHRLKDQALALRYAQALRTHATASSVPGLGAADGDIPARGHGRVRGRQSPAGRVAGRAERSPIRTSWRSWWSGLKQLEAAEKSSGASKK